MFLKNHIALYTIATFFSGCSTIWQTVKVDVPKSYIGWVYVIPVTDTSNLNIQLTARHFQINQYGVVYVPTNRLNLERDFRLLVYENGRNINHDIRYAGNVHAVIDSIEYNYVQFYLPSFLERKIPDADQYWRDKHWQYNHPDHPRFDSLLKTGLIVFK
jgi:hypothetical protein